MGSCCSSDSAAGENKNNKRESNYKKDNNNSKATTPSSLNNTQNTNVPVTPLVPSHFEPERELVFTSEAQEIFDAVSAGRIKLRDRKITPDQIQQRLNEIQNDVRQLRKIVSSTISSNPDNQVLLARSLNALGHTISTDRVGRQNEGLELQKEALQIYRRFYNDRDNEQVATSLNRVGVSLLNRGDGSHEEAIGYLQQALDMRRRLCASVGDHSELAASLNSLGIAYEWVGRHDDAAKLQQEALDMYLRMNPEKSERPDVHDCLDALNGVVSPRKASSFRGNDVLQKYRQEHPVQPSRHSHHVNQETGEREMNQHHGTTSHNNNNNGNHQQPATVSNASISFL